MTITFSSMKGGVGKTTESIMTATNLAARNFKVLYFDLDPNNSGTMFFTSGIENIENIIERQNVFEALSHNAIENYTIQSKIQNIDIIPSHLNIFKLRGIGYNELQKTLKTNKFYDFIIVDTAPTYDNIVINALSAADIILTPIKFTSFDFTTTCFLQKQLYDDIPNKVENWYILYSDWQEAQSRFPDSSQSQFDKLFKSTFQNILNVHIPRTNIAQNYTQIEGTKVSIKSSLSGSRRLATEFNKLVDMITGKENTVEKF